MSGLHAPGPSVLFVDESNTRLSFMAEHVARRQLGDGVAVASAGYDVREKAPSERAVACLAEHGFPVERHPPRPLRGVDLAGFDVVVALSRVAAEKVPRSARDRVVTWSVPDPWQGSDDAYEAAIAALTREVEALLDDRAVPVVAA